MSIDEAIQQAFAARKMPTSLLDPSADFSTAERSEAMSVLGRPGEALTAGFLQQNFEVIYWLTPDAFVYYLPGICRVGVREARPDLIINNGIVEMLARTPSYERLDNFFLSRWGQLTGEECAALQLWVLWLAQHAEESIDGASISRAFDMLDWLKTQRAAQ